MGGAVSLAGTATLTANGAGSLVANSTIGAASVTDSENTTLNGTGVTTTGDQDYTGTVTLGANTILASGTLELGVVTGGGKNLTFNNTGVATLNGAESGIGVLSASGGGTLVVNNNPSAASVSDSEGTTLNGGGVTTTGDQSYTGVVTLGANTILASGTLELAAVTGGGKNLTLNNTGLATLNGAVSGVNSLTADGSGTLLAKNTIAAANVTDSEGTTLSGGSVTTTGAQTYNGAITLGADTTLSGSTVGLNSTVDGAQALTVNGTTTFGGAIGNTKELTSITINGNLDINTTAEIEASSSVTVKGTVDVTSSIATVNSPSQQYGPLTGNDLTELPSGTVLSEVASVDPENVIKGIYNNQVKRIVSTPKAGVKKGPTSPLPPGQYLTRSTDVGATP